MPCTPPILFLSAAFLVAPLTAAQDFPSAAVEEAIRKEFSEGGMPGAVVGVVLGDEVVFELVLGFRNLEKTEPMTAATLFQIGSITKSMTGTMAGALSQKGTLSFDQTLGRFLPEEAPASAAVRALTLRQLASHSSGLPRVAVNREDLPNTPSVPKPYSIAQLYAGLESTKLVFDPGQRAEYSNLGFALLGHALERAAGKSYDVLLSEVLCEPLGMTATCVYPSKVQAKQIAAHYWVRDEPPVARDPWKFGEVVGHGGVISNMPDLAKYARLQWSTSETAPLDEATRIMLRTPIAETESGDHLGLGWFVHQMPGTTIVGHDGEVDGHSSSLAMLPDQKFAVIALVNRGGDAAPTLTRAALRAWWRAK